MTPTRLQVTLTVIRTMLPTITKDTLVILGRILDGQRSQLLDQTDGRTPNPGLIKAAHTTTPNTTIASTRARARATATRATTLCKGRDDGATASTTNFAPMRPVCPAQHHHPNGAKSLSSNKRLWMTPSSRKSLLLDNIPRNESDARNDVSSHTGNSETNNAKETTTHGHGQETGEGALSHLRYISIHIASKNDGQVTSDKSQGHCYGFVGTSLPEG